MQQPLDQFASDTITARAAVLFQKHQQMLAHRTDRLFAALMVFQWLVAVGLALWLSPKTWAGHVSHTHPHVWAALLLGGAITFFPVFLALRRSGAITTRHAIAISQMLMSSLLIHVTGGRIETHFHVFGSLAFLAFYRDWRVLVTASVVVVLDHLARGLFWPQSIYGVLSAPLWRTAEHGVWVLFEDVFLLYAVHQSVREMSGLAHRQAELEATKADVERAVTQRTNELLARAKQQSTVARLGIQALRFGPLQELLDASVAQVAERLEVEFCKVLEVMPDEDACLMRAGVGWQPGLVGQARVSVGKESQCGFTLLQDEPVVVEDMQTETRFSGPALLHEHGIVSGLSVVIKGAHRSFGVLGAHTAHRRKFTADDVQFVQSIANLLAIALEHEREHESAQRTQAALQESEQRFRELAESVEEVFWLTDADRNQIIYISPAYEKIWGRTCASLYGSPRIWLETIHPDDRARIASAVETKPARGDYDETYRILRPDGTVRWIHERAFPVRGATGEIIRVVGTAEDITERRQLEEHLRQSQKMEAIGQLAGGVAHDFNNILAVIMMQVELTAMTEQLPEPVEEGLGQIRAAAERAANLTRQLLMFSRKQVMQPRELDLNEAVTSLNKMLQRIIGEDVRLKLNLHPHPLHTRADAGMLDQLLMNLVVNARDAMPDGGRIIIETSEKVFTEAEAALIPDAWPGRHVCLRVTDTGSGISPENLAHIFEPFFTTKAPGEGTGLGLATVFGIVKQHGACLAVQTEVGRGTTFEIYLRATEKMVKLPEETKVKPKLRRGTETILLVEDEPEVRMLTRLVLEQQGYRILEAAHGVEALKIWEENQGTIQLLFTDIVMPEGINGRELAGCLRARNPKLRVIFSSGYSADFAGRELALQAGQHFIQKPSRPQEVLRTVRQCLDS